MTNATQQPGLLQRNREELQMRHYARRTVKTYEQWIRRFLRFHRMRHPCEMGEQEINTFLSHLATAENVSASTQNQTLTALLFLYRQVLDSDVENLEGVIRARRRPRLASGGAHSRRGSGRSEASQWSGGPGGPAAGWQWPAPHGGTPPEDLDAVFRAAVGWRSGAALHHGAEWKG
jgi:hypothetical protein